MGILSTCSHLGDETQNYRLYSHNANRRWFDVLESMSGTRVMQLPWGYDGCGIPCLALPLQRIALAMARFADAAGQSAERASAIARIQSSVTDHPYLVAGKDRLCTELMHIMAPKILVKVGAEGCYTASIPEQGLGIAIKMDDGHDRGARVALGAVLQSLGLIDGNIVTELEEYLKPELTNSRGEAIGRAEGSSEWQQVMVKQQMPLSL